MNGTGETSYQISIAETSDEKILAATRAIVRDTWNPNVQRINVGVSEPIEDFMATIAWSESRPIINLSTALCNYKVQLNGVARAPRDPDFTVSLIVGSYMEVRPRATEIIDCLEKNIDNDAVGDIHLFVEDSIRQWESWLRLGDCADEPPRGDGRGKYRHYPALEKLDRLRRHPKVTFVPFGRRPFFSEYFAYANQVIPAGRTVILSNSDIEFDQSVRLLGNHPLDGAFGSLSRKDGNSLSVGGADFWVFTTPTFDLSACRWTLGVNAGEFLLAHEAKQAGYVLLNPCLSVKGAHRHTSAIRRWPIFPRINEGIRVGGMHPVSVEVLGSKLFQEMKKQRGLR